MDRVPRTSRAVPTPGPAVVLLVWFAAVPWLVVVLRAARWDHDIVDVLAAGSGFVVTLPACAVVILGLRPTRPATVLVAVAAFNALPWVALGSIARSWGTFDHTVAMTLVAAWVVTSVGGVAFAFLADAGCRLARREPPVALARLSGWADRGWWTAAVVTMAIVLAATPVLVAIDGVFVVPVIVGGTLLSWTVSACALTRRTVAWAILCTLPVVGAGVGSEQLNTVVIAVLGLFAALMVPFLATRRSSEEPGGGPGRPHGRAPAGAATT